MATRKVIIKTPTTRKERDLPEQRAATPQPESVRRAIAANKRYAEELHKEAVHFGKIVAGDKRLAHSQRDLIAKR